MNSKRFGFLLVVGATTAVVMAMLLATAAWADDPFPPRPVPGLPPRPGQGTPAPTPKGGLIELYIRFDPTRRQEAEQWLTVVQWQDTSGTWHDVESWWGTLDEVQSDWGRKSWYVSRDHLSTGPFRWGVYDAQRNEVLATSESFWMPGSNGQIVSVWVDLEGPENDDS